MAIGTTAALLISGGLFAAGTALTISGQRQQAAAAERAQGEQQKQVAINNAQQSIARNRNIRQVIAQQRVLQAEQQQAGFASGFAGAVSAIGADTGSAIGAAQTQEAAARGIATSQNRQAAFITESRRQNASLQFGGVLGGLSQFNFGALGSAAAAPSGSGYASNRPLAL